MNILNLTGVIDNPYNEQFSYDQCIISMDKPTSKCKQKFSESKRRNKLHQWTREGGWIGILFGYRYDCKVQTYVY